MPVSRQTITLAFRKPPATMFEGMERASLARDHLTFELSGEEGMTLTFMAKEPGQGYRVAPTSMTFDYRSFERPLIEAYERLIHDALCGDPTLYTRADGIARVWEVIDPDPAGPARPVALRPGQLGPAGGRGAHRSTALAPAARPRRLTPRLGSVADTPCPPDSPSGRDHAHWGVSRTPPVRRIPHVGGTTWSQT